MRVFIIATALAFASVSARAQEVTLHLTVDQINTLLGHLDGKWSELNPIAQTILRQAQQPPAPPPKVEPPKKDEPKVSEKPKAGEGLKIEEKRDAKP